MPFRLFQRPQSTANRSTDDVITVVSGLPRSGTSMMMRMLEAGGIPVLTDHERAPDSSNPKGYYEYEHVKQMKEGDIGWIQEARGKAVKIISALLEFLPPAYEYRIIFMERNMAEILASQRAMLIQRGETHDQIEDQHMAELYQKHLARTSAWIEKQPNLKALYLDYNKIIEDPQPYLLQLASFLHPRPLKMPEMLAIVEASLYRQRRHRAESHSPIQP